MLYNMGDEIHDAFLMCLLNINNISEYFHLLISDSNTLDLSDDKLDLDGSVVSKLKITHPLFYKWTLHDTIYIGTVISHHKESKYHMK